MSLNRTNLTIRGVFLALYLMVLAFPAKSQISTPCSEIFFSEYIEGSSFNKCLEIFNGTGSTVDLSLYSIRITYNGGTSVSTISLGGSLATGDVYVICHGSASSTLLAKADATSGTINFTGDDAIELINGSVTVDVIGQIGFDPGSEWGSGLTSTSDNTLVRKPEINMGDANGNDAFDPSVEWDGYERNYFDDIGTHLSNDCDPCRDLALTVTAAVAAAELCEGEDVNLMEVGADPNIIRWEWFGPGGFMSTEQNPVINGATAAASGLYTVIGYEGEIGCSEMSTVEVIVHEFPLAPEVSDLAVCEGGSTLVDLSALIGPTKINTVRQVDFETGEGYTTSIPEYSDGFTDYFIRTDGSDLDDEVVLSNAEGTFFFAAQDLDEEGAVPPLYVYINDIDISGQSNLAMSVLLAEDQSSDGEEDWDASDEFLIDYRIDNGPWTPLLHVQNNGTTFNSAPFLDTDFDGNGDGAEITDVFTEYIAKITGLGNVLDLRITLDFNSNDEDIAFDNIIIGEYIPAVSSFNFYDTDPSVGGVVPLASMVSSYDPGTPGTFYVSALNGICEGPATEFEIIESQGDQPLNCSDRINLSLGPDCSIEVIPQMILEGEGVMFEFISIELIDASGHVLPNTTFNGSHVDQVFTVSAIDICNQNSCWGTILVEDKSGPLISCPETVTVNCYDTRDDSFTGEASIVALFCSNSLDITYSDISEILACDEEYQEVITRTFLGIDENGVESNRCTQTINVKRGSLDQVVYPEHYDGMDVHGGINDNGVGAFPPLECDGEGLVWNPILREDGLTVPSPYANGNLIGTGFPKIGPNTEGCTTILSVYEDMIIFQCDDRCEDSTGSYKILRTWTVIDWCTSLLALHEQIIMVVDLSPPVIYPFSELDTFRVDPWTCVVEELVIPIPEAYDNCTPDNLSYDIYGPRGIKIVDGVAFNVPVGDHKFRYYARDCCDNRSEPYVTTISVVDEVIPVAIAKQEIVLSLSYDVEEDDGSAKLFASSVDNGSYDNCSPVELRVRRESDPCRADSDEYGPYVKFCCRDVGKTFKVWLEVRDTSGNVNETWANVLVEDKFAVIECKDIYIECFDDIDDAIKANKASAYGTCRSKTTKELSRDYAYFDETCNRGVVYVTWGVRDQENITCVQAVYVNYQTSLQCDDIDWPQSFRETDCLDLEPYELTWTGEVCDLIGWTVISDTFAFESGACGKIVNNYVVIDWCAFDYDSDSEMLSLRNDGGYFEGANDLYDGIICKDPFLYEYDDRRSPNGVYQYVEVIKLTDDIAPQILLCDYDPYTITSGCSRSVSIGNIAIDNSNCPITLLTWRLTLTTEDGDEYEYIKRSRSGDVVYFDLVDGEGDPLLFEGPMSTHNVRWIVSDGCGNVSECETTFTVVDRKDPTPYCVHLSSAVMENGQVEIWARDFDLQSFDNCSVYDSLYFTFDRVSPVKELIGKVHYFDQDGLVESDIDERYAQGEIQKWDPEIRSSARVFTCADLPSITVDMSVWDEKYNMDYCEVTLDLVDNQDACEEPLFVQISGKISSRFGDGIGKVDLSLENVLTGEQLFSVTDDNGEYAFTGLPGFQNYELIPSRKGNITDGLSTEDVLLIQKFIMDENVFTSPYEVIASDINSDKRISAADVILLQRIIVGQLTELKDGIWRFVDASQELTISNALLDFRNNLGITGLDHDLAATDFIGVKIGDVTGDASTSIRDGLSSRSDLTSVITVEDKWVTRGEVIDVPLYFNDFNDMRGFQMTFTARNALIVGTVSGSAILYASNVGRLTDNMIAISYGNFGNTPESGHVFSVSIQPLKSGKLSEILDISDLYIQSEIYHGNNIDVSPLSLEFVSPDKSEAEFSIEQNVPNPFNSATTIDFTLPDAGNVTLSIYNVSGQLLFVNHGNFARGENIMRITDLDVGGASGVLYYTLTYGDQKITRKMIRIR